MVVGKLLGLVGVDNDLAITVTLVAYHQHGYRELQQSVLITFVDPKWKRFEGFPTICRREGSPNLAFLLIISIPCHIINKGHSMNIAVVVRDHGSPEALLTSRIPQLESYLFALQLD